MYPKNKDTVGKRPLLSGDFANYESYRLQSSQDVHFFTFVPRTTTINWRRHEYACS